MCAECIPQLEIRTPKMRRWFDGTQRSKLALSLGRCWAVGKRLACGAARRSSKAAAQLKQRQDFDEGRFVDGVLRRRLPTAGTWVSGRVRSRKSAESPSRKPTTLRFGHTRHWDTRILRAMNHFESILGVGGGEYLAPHQVTCAATQDLDRTKVDPRRSYFGVGVGSWRLGARHILWAGVIAFSFACEQVGCLVVNVC